MATAPLPSQSGDPIALPSGVPLTLPAGAAPEGEFTDTIIAMPGTVTVAGGSPRPTTLSVLNALLIVSTGVIGIALILADAHLSPGDVSEVLHGTTVGSNTLLQKAGAKTGLLTTRGFRDVLELGRRTRPRPYGLTGWFERLMDRIPLAVAAAFEAESYPARGLSDPHARGPFELGYCRSLDAGRGPDCLGLI